MSATAAEFSITTPAAEVAPAPGRAAEVAFTVTNVTATPLDVRLRPTPDAGTPPAWLRLQGDAERRLEPGAAVQVVVVVEPPLGGPVGRHAFRLDVVGIDQPDEHYAEGPSVVVAVPASRAPAATTPRGYLATVAGALAGGALGELLGIALFLTADEPDSGCADIGCAIGDGIAYAFLLAFLLVVAAVLMVIGASIGAAVTLRAKRYLGAKLTGLFFLIVAVPWLILVAWLVGQVTSDLAVVAVLVPLLFVAVPALLARGAVLLIRTRRI